MNSGLDGFEVDPTPRRADGEYMAHARISGANAGGKPIVHLSGDLAGFDLRDDAIQYARNWARQWLEREFAQPRCDSV